MTEQEKQQIKSQHPTSYRGIFYSYDLKEIRESRPFQISVALCVCLFVISLLSKKTSLELVTFWSSQIMTIFPNLLGFNLGGYALIIGFGNTDLIEAMTEKSKSQKISVFQKLSGIFAFAILLQLTGFMSAFLVNFAINLQFVAPNIFVFNIVNSIATILLSFLAIWGILILFNLVANVFSFGQGHHLKLTIQRKQKAQKKDFTV